MTLTTAQLEALRANGIIGISPKSTVNDRVRSMAAELLSLRALVRPKLLPCPHCGFDDELYPAYHDMGAGEPYAIDCLRCGYDFTPREGLDVRALWNKRPVTA